MPPLWAYLHPILQITALVMGLAALAMGLRLRRDRGVRAGRGVIGMVARHMSWGRGFVTALTAGHFLGLAGMGLALGEPLYRTAHAYFGTLALFMAWGTAYLGRRLRLQPGNADIRQIHSFCAFLCVFLVLAVAFLGMGLLP